MAGDTVSTNVNFSGKNRYSATFTNLSDGTGESVVKKIDISTLTGPTGAAPTKLVIETIQYDVQGFNKVDLLFEATEDIPISLHGSGYLDYRDVGGLVDPFSTGATGDLLLTTTGATSTSTYNITVTCRLKA